jgi:hypothetical protein
MNRLIPCLLLGLALAGCESVSERMQSRFSPVPPKVRVLAADRRTVYYAGQLAAKRMEFVLQRSSEADGFIEASSRIRPGDSVHSAQQFVLEVQLRDEADGRTEVALRLFELREGYGAADSGREQLREHGLYDSYFAVLERILQEEVPGKAPPTR